MTAWLYAAHVVTGRDELYCYTEMSFIRVMACYHLWLWTQGVDCLPIDEGELDGLIDM